MNKTAIKNYAIWARRKLISDITFRAGMLGITENGIAQPMKQSTKDVQFFDIGTKDYVEISGAEIPQRNALLAAIRNKERTSDYKTAFRGVVEEVAYTWFNRLVAVRFMEVNDYLPSHVRVLSSSNPNKLEPDFVTTPFETDLEFTPYERDVILQLKDQNKLDELFRLLFIKQCNKLGEVLPELFEKISDYTELLLTISFTDKDGVIYHLTHDISEDDFNVEKEGQVEIIGWMYQYYNTEPKDKVFENLKKNIKIRKEDIPAATQLFTPDWIVRYMVENSLGRLWVEGHPNDDLKATWKYYLEEAEQEPDVQVQLAKIREEYAKINPEDIKLIDPCMGSGHILVYAFDVLMQIYTSYGYTQKDAAKSILEKNLYGIDIDTRAYQLAYFAVMMKARQYNRRIFNEGILPNLMAVKNPTSCSSSSLKRLGDLKELGNRLIEDFRDAEEYGSILQLNYTKAELDTLDNRLAEIHEMSSYGDLLSQLESDECVNTIAPLVRQARIMGQKYDVVVTNPPYMGASGMNAKLSEFVRKLYPNSKSDMSTVCMERASMMCKQYGYWAMINIPVWMFIASYTNLRKELLSRQTIISLVHPGRGVFGSDFGSVAFVFSKTAVDEYRGQYCRLFDVQGDVKSVEEREQSFLSGKGRFQTKQHGYFGIPGNPLAYWVSQTFIDAFSKGVSVDSISDFTGSQHITADNDRFLRLFWEVDSNSIGKNKGWAFYAKGGDFRRWYGNISLVVDTSTQAMIYYKNNATSNLLGEKYWYTEGITYSAITVKGTGFRFFPAIGGFDKGGATICYVENLPYVLALLNSKVAEFTFQVLNPTVNLQVKDVKALPIIFSEENKAEISYLSSNNVQLARDDWNAFETSNEFDTHFLVSIAKEKGYSLLSETFLEWSKRCADRFALLKKNEEELNRTFISIYKLSDSLSPYVVDDDIEASCRHSNLVRDIKSLISYAVGCMLGRYSLDVSGLVFAGGNWDSSKYLSFYPDLDNCIPITDEAYFKNDIVGRFVDFIRIVYGSDTLEENLEFIANALGNSGNTPRNTIRQYFLKDFYKDHCQTYSITGSGKRPIYWLFDSGKQNGFKALVYMHRWNADTVGNLRVEYLHKMQAVYEKEIENCQDAIENSLNNREIAAATKRKEKLVKQLKECKDYDAKVAHIALSRINIDLDDGVKANYRKVQTGADGRFCEILADSKDIMVKEDSPLWQSLISNR